MVFPRIKYFDTFISWHLVFFKQIRNLRILFGNIWCFEDWTNLKFCLTSKKARYQRINLNFLFFSFFLAFLKSKKIRFLWRNPRKSGNPISLKKSKEIRFPWRNPRKSDFLGEIQQILFRESHFAQISGFWRTKINSILFSQFCLNLTNKYFYVFYSLKSSKN